MTYLDQESYVINNSIANVHGNKVDYKYGGRKKLHISVKVQKDKITLQQANSIAKEKSSDNIQDLSIEISEDKAIASFTLNGIKYEFEEKGHGLARVLHSKSSSPYKLTFKFNPWDKIFSMYFLQSY